MIAGMKDDPATLTATDLEPTLTTPHKRTIRRRPKKPTHYKVICISLYTRDLDELEAKVAELKRRGWTKANKSQTIRLALNALDLDKAGIARNDR